MNLLKLSLREISKKKGWSLLMFLVCIISMQTTLSAITNSVAISYQKKMFEDYINVDMEQVLHLDYQSTKESPEFTQTIQGYLNYIGELSGVEAVGRFDATGVYFSELQSMEEYKTVNGNLLKGKKYQNYPTISQVLYIDEEMLSFVQGGLTKYVNTRSGFLPLYASDVFKDILPVGTHLTEERTGEKYQIIGYIPHGAKWVSEDDLIRFPMVALNGWFIAPFSKHSQSDILTQLSTLHNTYVFLSNHANVGNIKEKISAYPKQHGFSVDSFSLAEEYQAYCDELELYIQGQVFLAVFISTMALSSVVAICTTNNLLKRKYYGILIANGFSFFDIAIIIAVEIFTVVFCSGAISWFIKLIELEQSSDLFREVLLLAHIQYTLPLYGVLTVILTGIASLIPTMNILKLQPYEQIGGNANGID